jgi:acyl-CoA synthetase (AMP-forming)/AMP-acid ligase II
MYGIEPGEMDVPGLPVFGLFSLAMGMTVAWPEIDPSKPAKLDPEALVTLIEDLGATNAFGGIAIWRPVLRWCAEHGRRLPSLRRLLSAGTAIPVWMHEGFREILAPGVQIHTPYGATEALPVASISTDLVLGETAALTRAGRGTCVGAPAPGVRIRVIPVSDEPIAAWTEDLPLPAGQIGEICVAGAVVTHLYEAEPEATKQAKILDPASGTIWHRMGDLGYQDEQGRLWFCGRKAHRVETAQGTLTSNPVEEVAVSHPKVARAALLALGERGQQEAALALQLQPGQPWVGVADEVRAMLAERAFAAPIRRVLFHTGFPVDVRHNAKIDNESLSAWATEALRRSPDLGLPGHEEGP